MPPLRPLALAGALALVGGPAAAQPGAGQRIVYVDAAATGAGDGSSWADAYRELRTALAAALNGDEVWVAAGTYRPTAGADRAATFALRSGVALYGGFDGTETARGARDWAVNETILSGEIGAPDDSTDNSYHVVTATDTDSTAVLDGFTIREGVANGAGGPTDPTRRGAGLYSVGGSPVVRHCLLQANRSTFAGSGVYNGGGGRLRLEECRFAGNVGTSLFNEQSETIITDGVFEGNVGPGVVNKDGSARMERVVFRYNLASTGGAMTSAEGSVVVCVDCTFEGSAAEEGGAVYDFLSTSTFVRARFVRNTAEFSGGGGAVYTESSTLRCLDCTFEGNTDGGAVFAREGDLTFVNAAFLGNTTTYRGAALSIDAGTVARLHNVVLAGNYSSGPGGALSAAFARFEAVGLTAAGNRAGTAEQHPGAVLYAEGPTASRLDNAVLWGNAGTGAVGGDAPVEVRHAVVEGGCAPPVATCERVADGDPLFARAPFTDGPSDWGDLRVQAGSPALDFGSAALLPPDALDLDGDGNTAEPLPLDLDGGPRVEGPAVDAGAYEGAAPVASGPGPDSGAGGFDVRVWPNPARGAVAIAFEAGTAGWARVEAFDAVGRRVAVVHDGPVGPGQEQAVWSVGAVAPGVYTVRVTTGAGRPGGATVVVR